MDVVSEAAAEAESEAERDDGASGADGAEHSPAVEHLQTAARELVAAARSFLDVVEEVVEDPERLSGAATSVVDLLREGLGAVARPSSPLEPWERAAWSAPEEPAADFRVFQGFRVTPKTSLKVWAPAPTSGVLDMA